MVRSDALDVLNDLVADGHETFTHADMRERLHRSAQATSNVLSRLQEDGLVDRVTKGRYVIRPLGRLHTSAAADDVALAVAAAFQGLPHRIAFTSALHHHGLLVRPIRAIQVACTKRVRIRDLSGRKLTVVVEQPETIDVGLVDAGHGAAVSNVERALLESARRMDLTGGVDVLADALDSARRRISPSTMGELANRLPDGRAALRRLGALLSATFADDAILADIRDVATDERPIPADPQTSDDPGAFIDRDWNVRFSKTDHELLGL